MVDKGRLREKAAKAGVLLEDAQLEQLDLYAQLLVAWNEKVNLTSILQPEEIEDKHFIDSLVFAARADVMGSLVDVGSGAGFPGLVAKVLKPQLAVTLMEPTGKKVRFLQEVAQALGLEIEVLKERAEEAARKRWRENYSVSTARAVAGLPILCEYCLPLTKVGGRFVAMKAQAEEELLLARAAVEKLGGRCVDVWEYVLPGGARRSLITIEKVAATPEKYPRNGGTIAKRPL
ncbi:MAG: 16S rRNA (guanine(527)-N(7))-methyltransferase RsmG [Oscillospiraceae bacterium]